MQNLLKISAVGASILAAFLFGTFLFVFFASAQEVEEKPASINFSSFNKDDPTTRVKIDRLKEIREYNRLLLNEISI